MAWVKDDPVRPNIPLSLRIGERAEIFAFQGQDRPLAITCVSYQDCVPEEESQLFAPTEKPTIAVFYSIWSYRKGAGRELILGTLAQIRANKPEIDTFVTLSPKTQMARDFHLKNGATIYRENADTINYQYR